MKVTFLRRKKTKGGYEIRLTESLTLRLTSIMNLLATMELEKLDATPFPSGNLRAKAILVVNVASQCGLTPQYKQLQALSEAYKDKGLLVIGVPCNQFGGQEPGSAEEIASFCTANYGVTFPLLKKTKVNGPDAHPLYKKLVQTADAEGKAGDVEWNFEKFLVVGDTVTRFRPSVTPQSPPLIAAIEQALA